MILNKGIMATILKQEELPELLQMMLKYPETRSHMLFIGPPGSGKTTTAQSFAVALHGKVLNSFSSVMFLNSSDERSLDMIRTKIYQFVESRMQSLFFQTDKRPPKVVIFDEAETLTDQAQCALRPLLQRSTNDIIIIFICNSLSHIHPQILNKFVVIPFIPTVSTQLQRIVNFSIPKLDVIFRRGDIRFFKNCPGHKRQITRCIARTLHASSKEDVHSILWEHGIPTRERVTWFLLFNHHISHIDLRELQLWSSLSSSEAQSYISEENTINILYKLWAKRMLACLEMKN